MKNKKLYAITAFAITIVFFCGLYLFYSDRQHSFVCSSNTTYVFEKSNQENEALLQTNMRFGFENGKGYNIITGHLKLNGKDYAINRKALFNYSRTKNNSYTLITTEIFRSKTDNLPKELGERYLYRFSTEPHESTHLTIINMNNGKKLFSSGTLPYFICE